MSKRDFKLPSRVRITQRIAYEVVYVETFQNPNVLGECRFDSKQIVIKSGQSPRETRKTLIHEIYHAMSFETPKLNLTEAQVLALEKATDRVLRLNDWYEDK
jgi:hypothetical protein